MKDKKQLITTQINPGTFSLQIWICCQISCQNRSNEKIDAQMFATCSETVLKSMALRNAVRDWSVCNGFDSTKSGREDSEIVSEKIYLEDRKKSPPKVSEPSNNHEVCSNTNNVLIIMITPQKTYKTKNPQNNTQCFQKQWRNGIFTQISILLLSLLDKDQSATDNDP